MNVPPDNKKPSSSFNSSFNIFIPIICYLKALQNCLGFEENTHLTKLSQFIAPVDRYATLLPLRNCYEILRIDENYCVEKYNEDITERTNIFERSNKKIHKGTNSRFVNKVSGRWFFHRDEINQKLTVLPGHRSYANTT